MKIGENATGFIKAAAGSPRVHPGEPMKNAAEICSVIDQAQALKADVLVLPELVLSGYTAADLFLRAPLLEGVLTALECIKDHLKRPQSNGLIVVLGAPIRADGRLFNCAVFLQNGRVLGIVPKSHLPNYQEFYEARWFSPASEAVSSTLELLGDTVPFGTDLIFESASGLAVAAEICEDLWVAQPPAAAAKARRRPPFSRSRPCCPRGRPDMSAVS